MIKISLSDRCWHNWPRLTMKPFVLFAILLAGLSTGLAQSQTRFALSMAKAMTVQELQETGVAGLSPAQRAALDRWLNAYTLRVFKATVASNPLSSESSTTKEYAGTGGGHWIKENGNGKIITLDDESIWEVDEADQVDTALWLPTTDVRVIRKAGALGAYKYSLINTEDGETAAAKYLGR